MRRVNPYLPEFGLLALVLLISILGFWDVFIGVEAEPQPHHFLHLATAFIWLGLLVAQLTFVARGEFRLHRKLGLAVLLVGPVVVATTAMLSVHSAHKGLVSGEGDFLIIQNVGVTLELAVFIALAFLLKARRKLHGSLLLSTSILFMGIALFFALISFAPPFRIEGPKTFYRFQTAAITGQVICLVVGVLYFFRDVRNGWPFLAAPLCFFLNEAVRTLLSKLDLLDDLTRFIGSMSAPIMFIATFVLLSALLAATALPAKTRPRTA